MTLSTKFSFKKFVIFYSSLFVFLFFALTLSSRAGSGVGALMLTLAGIVALFFVRPRWTSVDLVFAATLLFYFIVFAITNAYHQLPQTAYDNPSRFLLAIFAFAFVTLFPPRAPSFFIGGALGALGAGLVALWQVAVVGLERAAGALNAIQFGDIALLLIIPALAGILWVQENKKSMLLAAFFLLAMAFGLLASILSGSRGGWLAIPFLLVLFSLELFRHHRAKAMFYVFLLLIVCAGVFVVTLANTSERIAKIPQELQEFFVENNASTSIGSRLHMWNLGVHAFMQKPVMGWGDLLAVKAANADEWKTLADSGLNFTHLHNEYLDALVKRGALGFIGLLAVFLGPLLLCKKEMGRTQGQARIFALSGVMVVVSVMCFCVTQVFFAHSSGSTFYPFMLLIVWSYLRQAQKVNQ